MAEASVTSPPTRRLQWASRSIGTLSPYARTSVDRWKHGWVFLTTRGLQWVGKSLKRPLSHLKDFRQVRAQVSPLHMWRTLAGQQEFEWGFLPPTPPWGTWLVLQEPSDTVGPWLGCTSWTGGSGILEEYEVTITIWSLLVHINSSRLVGPGKIQDSSNWSHRSNSGNQCLPYIVGPGNWVNISHTVES